MNAQSFESIDVGAAINVIEVVSRLVLRYVNSEEQVSCRGASEPPQVWNYSLEFGARGKKNEKLTTDDFRSEVLIAGLLELVDTLAQLPVAADGRRTEAQTSGDGASKGSQLTDALKIDQAGSLLLTVYHDYTTVHLKHCCCLSRCGASGT